jgi:hypothetical protein
MMLAKKTNRKSALPFGGQRAKKQRSDGYRKRD